MLLRKIYYAAKPLIPRGLQLSLRRARIRMLRDKYQQRWPIYGPAAKGIGSGIRWPNQKQFALVLTHDVEGPIGRDRCEKLVQVEKELGFRSAFYFVPERYTTSSQVRKYITDQGFEVGVHGLNHDGKLYNNATLFAQRVLPINHYLDQWDVNGFSSPCAHHNLAWTSDLNIRYAVTTYDTDPFEPQGGGIATVFPFRVHNRQTGRDYIEIPYTLPQDFALYVLMKEKTTAIWKQKLEWIAQCGGMLHLKTHPDYMSFEATTGTEEYPISYYADFLRYVRQTYSDQYWHVCPNELADFCFENTDNDPWIPTNGDTLCASCHSLLHQKKVLAFGIRGDRRTDSMEKNKNDDLN